MGQELNGSLGSWVTLRSLRLAAVRVGRCGQQCVYLERCIKNDLNLSGGLVLRVVTHSLIGLD